MRYDVGDKVLAVLPVVVTGEPVGEVAGVRLLTPVTSVQDRAQVVGGAEFQDPHVVQLQQRRHTVESVGLEAVADAGAELVEHGYVHQGTLPGLDLQLVDAPSHAPLANQVRSNLSVGTIST